MRLKGARIGCRKKRGGKEVQGRQAIRARSALPRCAGQNSLRRTKRERDRSAARQKSLELVAARRDGERKCRGGKLFGHAVPCPACGAKLREERAKVCGFCYASKVARIGCRKKRGERKCRGGKLFGHAVPCPACGAKLREDRAKRV